MDIQRVPINLGELFSGTIQPSPDSGTPPESGARRSYVQVESPGEDPIEEQPEEEPIVVLPNRQLPPVTIAPENGVDLGSGVAKLDGRLVMLDDTEIGSIRQIVAEAIGKKLDSEARAMREKYGTVQPLLKQDVEVPRTSPLRIPKVSKARPKKPRPEKAV